MEQRLPDQAAADLARARSLGPLGERAARTGPCVAHSPVGPPPLRREETEWFRVVTWNRLAEICSQYLAKGRQVYVEGRLQTRSWEGQDGQTRYTTELIAQEVKFLGSQRDAEFERAGAPQLAVGADTQGDVEPDDLPF